eukprot:COSAG02_NODE_1520_length_12166_cov_8.338195_3_plen_56_part_00
MATRARSAPAGDDRKHAVARDSATAARECELAGVDWLGSLVGVSALTRRGLDAGP